MGDAIQKAARVACRTNPLLEPPFHSKRTTQRQQPKGQMTKGPASFFRLDNQRFAHR